jgi:hypothetical protein
MSNMNAEERDKILDDFIKDSKKDLNETIARENLVVNQITFCFLELQLF